MPKQIASWCEYVGLTKLADNREISRGRHRLALRGVAGKMSNFRQSDYSFRHPLRRKIWWRHEPRRRDPGVPGRWNLVDGRRLELPTSALRTQRSPN
jgi:hypothetical protein